ncbi:hypothetical protein BC834DRAFT_160550 [Gloeopeniophorella convolvens]|nr:hypothetical protein BC834DRAFT_160550 [Gloeopeniophorella convolvens]
MAAPSSPKLPTPRFRVAICGAGPAGVTLAAAITHYADPAHPVAIDLYDSAPAIGTVGAGVALWQRTRWALNEMGLLNRLATAKPSSDGFMFQLGEGPNGEHVFHTHVVPDGGPLALHRNALLDALKSENEKSPHYTFHPSAKLVSYAAPSSPGAPLVLAFADGSTAHADVLIGADGIRSPVRASMYAETSRLVREQRVAREAATPKWTGTIAFRSLVNIAKLAELRKDHPACTDPYLYCGKDKHIVTYPISPTLINFIGYYTVPGAEGTTFEGKWVEDARVDDVRARFAGWVPDVQVMLDCLETVSAWAIHIIEDLPHAADGPVAIIGDAAHAIETHFASGAGSAIEDAFILGRLLAHPSTATSADAEHALSVYDRFRFRFIRESVTRARVLRNLYEFSGDHGPHAGPDWVVPWREVMENQWEWVWKRTPAEMWTLSERALLEGTGV